MKHQENALKTLQYFKIVLLVLRTCPVVLSSRHHEDRKSVDDSLSFGCRIIIYYYIISILSLFSVLIGTGRILGNALCL